MAKTNPVEKAFKKLSKQWQSFLDSDKPIYHWKIASDDVQLVNAFIKVKEQFDENNPDFFAHLSVPFVRAKTFGWDLANEFNHLVQEGLEDSSEEGEEPVLWQEPETASMSSGFQALLVSADHFLNHFGEVLESLVLVVAPPSVKDGERYSQWWEWACKIHRDYQEWPIKLKLVVFDHVNSPFLESLIEAYPEQIYSDIADCDYRGALQNVLDDANDGSDSAQVRQAIFTMNNAVADQDGPSLKTARAAALPLAVENQWFDIAATITMISGAALMSWQHYASAIKEYQNAQAFAEQGLAKEIPGSDKLKAQAMLNHGTCLYLDKQHVSAAVQYETAAQYAEETGDLWLSLEAWRMGSFSLEQGGQTRDAWRYGENALNVGRKMDDEKRQQSTLPFVGQALLRMSPNSSVSREVDSSMVELLGSDWKDNLEHALS